MSCSSIFFSATTSLKTNGTRRTGTRAKYLSSGNQDVLPIDTDIIK